VAKAAARERWSKADFNKGEEEAYGRASRALWGLARSDEEEAATRQVSHLAGMRAVEEEWEHEWELSVARVTASQVTPGGPVRNPQPQQQQQVQQQRSSPQQGQDRPAQWRAQPQAPLRQQGQLQGQQVQPQASQQQASNWAQRAVAAVALPQMVVGWDFKRIGHNGKVERDPTGLEPIKRALPWDERAILFERATGTPQIDQVVAASAVAQVNIALSKVAPPHVRTEAFKISGQTRFTSAARAGASAAMLLHFKKEIIEAARQADKAIINVVANETWAELKILVPYAQYRHQSGLADLRGRIEAENEGVVVPPFSMRWMRAKRHIEQHYQAGTLPQNAVSVVFKVCSKVVGNRLLTEMWVAGVKFRALPFIADRADTLCSRCCWWGHSEFRCHQGGAPVCVICSGQHRTEGHRCEVATCGKQGKICPHTAVKCPNCGGIHPAQDARCKAKGAAIQITRGGRVATPRPETREELECSPAPPPTLTVRPGPQGSDEARNSGSSGPLNWVPGVSLAAPPRGMDRGGNRGYDGDCGRGIKWRRPTRSRLMAIPRENRKLLALQHNCARGGQVLEAVLETAVRMEADLVLIQETREAKEKDSTRSHPSFAFIRGEEQVPAKCWIAVNRASRCRVTELKELARECWNHVQVVEVVPPGGEAIIVTNVYDQHEGSEANRPAQRAAWTEIARHG